MLLQRITSSPYRGAGGPQAPVPTGARTKSKLEDFMFVVRKFDDGPEGVNETDDDEEEREEDRRR